MLQVHGLSAAAPDGTVVVDDVSFSLERGWVVAVVGPTGAGKTSLLEALTGALPATAGTIRLDGADVLGGDEAIQRRIGFVPQDDVLHPQLDLRRTLGYAASLRLPPDVGPAGRDDRVGAVLDELGLTAHADQPVHTLSGGQRKRASVAVELVGEPDVLVLDEPTAGLDPGYEKSVLTMLRELADAGRTVLTVTHSLQALAVCDRVLFLAPGGKVAFFGPPAAARAYFEGAAPADVFLALHREPAHAWKERFRSHPAYARYVEPIGAALTPRRADHDTSAPSRPSWGSQLAILLRRYVDIIRADKRLVVLLALQGPMLGALLWMVLRPASLGSPGPGSATVALFFAVSVTWVGTAAASREIVKERRILRQERGTGLSMSAYVGSKVIALGALTIVEAAVLTVIACARQAPPESGAVLSSGRVELVAASALVGVAAVALGLLLSAAVASPDKALTVLPVALVSQLVLSGSWVSAQRAPGLRQLRSLTSAHWGVRLVEATVAGDRRGWWFAAGALLALTFAALAATIALVHRQVRPARVPVPLAHRAAQVMPRLAPVGLAVLVLCSAGAGSWALVDARSTKAAPERELVALPPASTTTPELLTTPAASGAEPTRATAASPQPAPAAPAKSAAAIAEPDPVDDLVDVVTDVVDEIAAPVTDLVDEVIAPPTTVPAAPAVTVPAKTPARSLQSLFEFAWQMYLLAQAAEQAQEGLAANP